MKKKIVEEYNWGVYVWKVGPRKVIKNESGQLLMIMSKKGNLNQIEKLRMAALQCGVEEGEAVFLSGNRPITDEEHEYQMSRLLMGLVPDELDYFAAVEEMDSRKLHGNR
jgi:hypothetical protein